MAVTRDWTCRNPECGHDFESRNAAPDCPKCKSHAQWRPSGGHVRSASTTHADRTLRDVAGQFGLTNLKSAREGEAAHPGLPQGRGNYGKYMGVDVTDRPTAGFGDWAPKGAKIGAPVGAADQGKFKAPKGGRNIPTQIKHVDPRKIPL